MGKRLLALDYFRGMIIVVMFLIHFNDNFFRNHNSFFDLLDFVVFGFIMLIGVSVSYHYMQKFNEKPSLMYFLKRALNIYLLYEAYALLNIILFRDGLTFMKAARTLLFMDLNYNILILIPITFYFLITPLMLNLLKKIDPYYFALIGAVIYVVSYAIDFLPFDSPLRFAKALSFGHMDWLTFPVLQWIFPYMFGISLGHYIRSPERNKGVKLMIGGLIFLIATGFLSMLLFSGQGTNINATKFPPTGYHMAYSIGICMLLMGLLLLFNINFPLLLLLGQNSLVAYMLHWFLILFAIYFNININPLIMSTAITIVVVAACLLWRKNANRNLPHTA